MTIDQHPYLSQNFRIFDDCEPFTFVHNPSTDGWYCHQAEHLISIHPSKQHAGKWIALVNLEVIGDHYESLSHAAHDAVYCSEFLRLGIATIEASLQAMGDD